MEKITVEVSLIGWLRRYTKEKDPALIRLESGEDIHCLIQHLNIPKGEIGSVLLVTGDRPEEKLVIEESYVLNDKDRILLIPIILGG